MNLSERIKKIAPSPTLAMAQRAREMAAEGINVINFSVGEPDFDTPDAIKDAAKKALDEGFTKYAPVAGIPELKNAITEGILKNRGVKYSPSQIITTCGAKSAIFIALQVMLNDGDEIIVPAPYWVSYPDQVKLAGGRPVIVQSKEENRFKITPNEIESTFTGKTKAIIINSPSNPTGSVYSKKELAEIAEVCISKNIFMIADEIYDRLTYDGVFSSLLSSHPTAIEYTIYINGVSKGFAMTGWRMGYAAGPAEIIGAMTKYQGQLLTSITTFVQKAAVTALTASDDLTSGMISEFKKRRNLITDLLDKIPGLSCIKPAGAFYAFPNVRQYLERKSGGETIGSAARLAEYLLNEAHVAVVPGSAFGTEGYIRLSFATSEDNIKEGMKRIKDTLLSLRA